jgi:hypothetical protein
LSPDKGKSNIHFWWGPQRIEGSHAVDIIGNMQMELWKCINSIQTIDYDAYYDYDDY